MKVLFFLADRVFRFRYRDPSGGGGITWDIGIYEEESNKMLRDFFFMGAVLGGVPALLLAAVAFYVR